MRFRSTGPRHGLLGLEAWAAEGVLARLIEQLQQARIRVKVIIGLFNEPDDHCKGSPLIRDLPPTSRTSIKFVKSVNQENDGHEEEQIYR